ncbi:MAG: response regulator transcription factor [Cyanobacteriota bacterium]
MNKTQNPYRILLVEDDESISEAVKDGLVVRNYEVTIINNGKQALRALEKLSIDSYHLVLLDLMLPGANGWEILVKIRSLPATCKWPVIMLTAIEDESCESRALYDGANDYITKPFSIKILAARIEACLKTKTNSYSLDFDLHFSDGNFKELSQREKVILGYVARGYSNREIAQEAFISEVTVGNHIRNIFQKLGVSSRTQAAILALKYNLADM